MSDARHSAQKFVQPSDLPKVDRLLASGAFAALLSQYGRPLVLSTLREHLQLLRQQALAGELQAERVEYEAVAAGVQSSLLEASRPSYQRVINATGVVLHTGLGRACLAPDAVRVLANTAGRAQRLELDLDSGERGGRDRGCARLLAELTGAEAATVVNNNAGATLLILAALATARGVLLSRGEMVEIGGSYRIPEIMAASGARLVGVGTTNRTHEKDYRRALDEESGMILKVHPSNYRVIGFTHEVPLDRLAVLAREAEVPLVHDLGSGCLIDLRAHGLEGEHRVQDSLAAGADLVCFSGDKLLGGPQAGLIVGRRDLVEQCRQHPLFRALRPGRLIYSALEATLQLYREGEQRVLERIPTLTWLTEDAATVRRRAQRLRRRLREVSGLQTRLLQTGSQAGSGSLPAQEVRSWALALSSPNRSADSLSAALRHGQPPVLARVRDREVLLDLRTVQDDELDLLASGVRCALAEGSA